MLVHTLAPSLGLGLGRAGLGLGCAILAGTSSSSPPPSVMAPQPVGSKTGSVVVDGVVYQQEYLQNPRLKLIE